MSEAISRLNAKLADRYEIESELGEGGMATVYLARDLKHNRKVAIKVLKPELAAVVGAARFLAEIETTANLRHPHIVPLFDSGEADGLLYYVMPLVEGESLRDRLKREGRLSVEEALAITKDVAAALSYAHTHGVIHRDIKPANVLIEDVVGTMADLVTEGKVAALGLSAIDGATLERAQTVHAIVAVQNEYSLIQRQAEVSLLPALDGQATTLVAFSPLGRGIICGNLVGLSDRDPADYRISDARFAPDRSSTIVTQLQPLWKIAQQREVPPAVVALAWLLAKSPKVSVIPGARSPIQIGISMQAAVFRLSAEEYEHLDSINAVEPKSGLRHR